MKRMAAALALLAAAPVARPFDPTLDPAFQLKHAQWLAAKQHKNILLDLGGNWCVGCLLLERLFEHDRKVAQLLSANYVLVHVNVSPDNLNASFTSRFPKATGYPFLIVLAPNSAKVIHSQGGLALQAGDKVGSGYDPASVAAFLARWSPRASGHSTKT